MLISRAGTADAPQHPGASEHARIGCCRRPYGNRPRPPASNREHPIPEDDEADYHELMNKGGYSLATQLHVGGDERSVVLTVWGEGIDASRPGQRARPGSPKYLVDVELNPAGSVETVAAAGVVDLMNLLATWAPVVQAAYVCDEAAERWKKDNGLS